MGHIIQNTDKNGNPLYPVTVTDAVVDKEGKTLSAILASGIAGQEEVYIGEEEPTDDNIKVWINPSENGGVPSEGGGDIAYVYMPLIDDLTYEQIEKNKEAYTRIINGAHMVMIIPDQEWSGVEKINVDAYYLTPEDETITFGLVSHNTSTSDGAITDESVVWIAGFLSSDGTVEYDEFEEEYPDVKKLEIKVNLDGELSEEDKAHNAEMYEKLLNKSGEYILYASFLFEGAVYESNASIVFSPDGEYPLGFLVQAAGSSVGGSILNYVVDVESDGSVEMYALPSNFAVWVLGLPTTFSELYQSMIDSELNLFDTGLGANVFVLFNADICTLDPYYIFSTMTSGEEKSYEARFTLTSQMTGFKYLFEAYSDGDVCNYAVTHGGVLRPTADADTVEAQMNKLMFSGKASIDSYVNPCTFLIIANQRKAFTPLSYEPIFGDNKVVVAYKMVVWDGGFFTIQFNNDGTAQMEVIE